MIEIPAAYKTPEFKSKAEIAALVVLCLRALSHRFWGMSAVGLIVAGALCTLLYLFYFDQHYAEEQKWVLRWASRIVVGVCPLGFALVNSGVHQIRYVMLVNVMLMFVIVGVRYWFGTIGREAIIKMLVIYTALFSIGSR